MSLRDESYPPSRLTTEENIRQWLIDQVALQLGIESAEIDPAERLSAYGCTSVNALALLSALSDAVGRKLSVTLYWEYPTINALARHVHAQPAAKTPTTETASVRPQDPGGAEPIAIIGMACRLPGASSVDEFWKLLRGGRDAVRQVPPDRWDIDTYYDPDPAKPGAMITRKAGFLDGVDRFEPLFFGISPREAAEMDPQQRLALELSWEALEDAGLPGMGLQGSRTGVFMGALWRDYGDLVSGDLESVGGQRATGHALNMIAHRVSYALGLQGPSMLVDTACSSALVALHLACQSLWQGDSTLALVGGINLILAPNTMVALSKFGGLAPDGLCKAFDASADGFGRGEGGGVVVLKPLSRAIADGDRIHCVIRGTAINNDGPSNGLTAPNPQAQEDVLRTAYSRAGIAPERVQYVETHGTGTALGDPIEASALGAVLGAGRPAEQPLRIGSVKTNIGHLEGAAGMAGVIKAALALTYREIPPSLHFEQPNPHIPFDELRLKVVRELEPWPDDGPAVAGVSSFGWGGTNAHVVLEESPASELAVLRLSADDEAGLRIAAEHARTLARGGLPLGELRAMLSDQTATKPWRLSACARSRTELIEQLDAYIGGRSRPGLVVGQTPASRPKLVFVCSPQGSQWLGMARRLMSTEPVFRATMQQCDRAFFKAAGWSLLTELGADQARSRLGDCDVVQPCLVAIQISLAAQLVAWGMKPDVVVGHSIGEVSAAHIAGILNLEDTFHVAHHYSRLQKLTADTGAMAVVELAATELEPMLAPYGGRVVIGGYNSPSSSVLSGEPDAVKTLLAELKGGGVLGALIKVNVAAHSAGMDPILAEMSEVLQGIRPGHARTPMISTLTGEFLNGPELTGSYFPTNLRQPVRFAQVMQRLLDQGCELFIELSPNPVLLHAMEQCAAHAGRQAKILPSLQRDVDERLSFYGSAGVLYAAGISAPVETVEPTRILLLSARTPEALREQARSMATHLAARPDLSLDDVCYAASARRSHLLHRAAMLGRTRPDLIAALDACGRGEAQPAIVQGHRDSTSRPGVVFVFPGQGSQWLGMGRQLLATAPAFRACMEELDQAIQSEAGWSVLAELNADAQHSQLHRIDVIQPALFAMQVALAALWRSYGVEPDAVIGHSMGEVAAVCVAGALDIPQAARIICRRSKLLRRVSGQGAMALVELTMDQVPEVLRGLESRLSIAVSNSPRSTVLSGDPGALDEVLSKLERSNVFCRRIKVDVASHSPQMDPLTDELLALLGDLRPMAARLPIYSTVIADAISGDELTAEYWVRNLRAPVLFSQTIQRALATGHELFVEVSPHPILLPSVQEGIQHAGRSGRALASLRRDEDEARVMLESLADLHVHGGAVSWQRFHASGGRCVPLPAYPWQRQRFWMEPALTAGRAQRRGGHPLVGTSLPVATMAGTRLWDTQLSADEPRYLGDHRVQDAAILPAAAYLEMALAAAEEAVRGQHALVDVSLANAMVLREGAPRQVQLMIAEDGARAWSFRVLGRDDADRGIETWTEHSRGRIVATSGDKTSDLHSHESLDALRARLTPVPAADHYELMGRCGLNYGPAFQGVIATWQDGTEALGHVRLPSELAPHAGAYRIHPALLDAALQVLAAALLRCEPDRSGPVVPVAVRSFELYARPGTEVFVHVRLAADRLEGDVTLLDAEGRPLAHVAGLRVTRLSAAQAAEGERLFLVQRWEREDATPAPLTEAGRWLVLADRRGLGTAVREHLEAQGADVACIAAHGTAEAALSGWYGADFTAPEGLDAALRNAFADGAPCRGVVDLRALDEVATDEACVEAMLAAQTRAYGNALHLVQALGRTRWRDMPRLWLVTCGLHRTGEEHKSVAVAQAPVWGLGRTVAYEHPELHCTRVDLALGQDVGSAATALVGELLSGSRADEVALRPDGRYVGVLGHETPGTDQNLVLVPAAGHEVRLNITAPGLLDHLVLQRMYTRDPGPGEVLLEVEHAGLNFIDVMKALGIYPGLDNGPISLGGECAGRILAIGAGVEGLAVGQEVVAVAPFSMASRVIANAALVYPRPAKLAPAEAATVSLVFMTAWYALRELGRIRPGERVLIHSAAGGTGLAAVQIAQSVGAQVFATAGSEAKRAYLRSLGIQHVMSSRSLDFVDEILEATGGKGVDLVLNSLAGEALEKSLSVLAPDGRFLELGKRDIYADQRALNMAAFRKRISFHAIDLLGLAADRPERFAALFREVMSSFELGTLAPLPVRDMPVSRAEDAFRTMAQGEHIGKIALSLHDPEARVALEAHEGEFCRPNATYLITGGLGGLGLSVARWLVEQGARHLVLVGRNGAVAPAQKQAVAALEAAGARVEVVRADIADAKQVQTMVADIEARMPPLGGVVHAAGVLADALVAHQDLARFREVMGPKAAGAWNLHLATRGRSLDFFVLYSSVASLIGNPGQGNYAAANACLDALAHHRRASGLPALSINWGAFAEVGLAAAQENRGERLSERGMKHFLPDQGTALLGRALGTRFAQMGIVDLDVRQWVESYPQVASATLFARLASAARRGPDKGKQAEILDELTALPEAARRERLEALVSREAARVLRMDPSQIELHMPLKGYGIDSLTGLELRNRLEASLGLTLGATLLWTYPTTAALAAHLGNKLGVLGGDDGQEADKARAEEEQRALREEELEALSASEAELLLEEKLLSFEELLR